MKPDEQNSEKNQNDERISFGLLAVFSMVSFLVVLLFRANGVVVIFLTFFVLTMWNTNQNHGSRASYQYWMLGLFVFSYSVAFAYDLLLSWGDFTWLSVALAKEAGGFDFGIRLVQRKQLLTMRAGNFLAKIFDSKLDVTTTARTGNFKSVFGRGPQPQH